MICTTRRSFQRDAKNFRASFIQFIGDTIGTRCALSTPGTFRTKSFTSPSFIGELSNDSVKVTYLGIRSAHERVWLVEEKPIWLSRAYLTRGDLEPARGNVHVCKLVRELTNIQIRTVTAETLKHSKCICPTNALQLNERAKERTKEGRKEGELGRKRERRNSYQERERALNSIRPETNNSGLCWIDTRISFLLPFTPALDNRFFRRLWSIEFTEIIHRSIS